ncbi:MAG TPA: hypothetical protein VFC56_19300 [Stellaceae bacterium]|nr:hypothetical protein [Stellaceae bacterium]
MIAVKLPELRLNHALGGAVALLAGLAIWPWLVPPRAAARPLAAPQAAAPAPLLAALPELSTYAAIVERPLFTPSRRAPPGAAAAAPGPSIESRYRLVGIMGAGATRKAFVAEGAHRAEIAEGDLFDGWTVKEIGRDRVLLTSPAGEAALKLSRAPPEPAKAQ